MSSLGRPRSNSDPRGFSASTLLTFSTCNTLKALKAFNALNTLNGLKAFNALNTLNGFNTSTTCNTSNTLNASNTLNGLKASNTSTTSNTFNTSTTSNTFNTSTTSNTFNTLNGLNASNASNTLNALNGLKASNASTTSTTSNPSTTSNTLNTSTTLNTFNTLNGLNASNASNTLNTLNASTTSNTSTTLNASNTLNVINTLNTSNTLNASNTFNISTTSNNFNSAISSPLPRPLHSILADLHHAHASLAGLSNELFASCHSSVFSLADYTRYGRQMILPDVGLPGQLRLFNASVLVIGAGGLGCPALLYLARAGVGTISIVDHDSVHLSNLHRQVLHSPATVGMNKAESAKLALLAGNPHLQIHAYPMPFVPHRIRHPSAKRLPNPSHYYLPELSQFSLLLDCTDNSPTRYFISDASAALGVPLVSGAAIRSEGQLSVWNLPPPSPSCPPGPCYRCVFPKAHPSQNQTCADEGVLGPAVGAIGVMMAWEAIRLLLGNHDLNPRLLLLPSFRSLKLRPRQPHCSGCGPNSRNAFWQYIADQSSHGQMPLETMSDDCTCLAGSSDPPSPSSSIIGLNTATLARRDANLDDFHVIDVRPRVQFGICALANSTNLPFSDSSDYPQQVLQLICSLSGPPSPSPPHTALPEKRILFVCRRGRDSLITAKLASDQLLHQNWAALKLCNLEGGLEAYARDVDHSFPIY